MSCYEDALTAAEKKAVKSRIRATFVDSVINQLQDDVHNEVRKLLKKEFAALKKDKKFMDETRKEIKAELLAMAKAKIEDMTIDI